MIRTFAPHRHLQPFIQQYVYAEIGTDGQWTDTKIAPLGYTALTLVLGKGKYPISVNGEYQHIYNSPIFTGQITGFSDIQLYGRLKILFAAFKPCGAFRLLGIPQHLCTGKSIPLSDLLEAEGASFSRQVVNLSDPHEAYLLLDQFLLQQLACNKASPPYEQLMHVSERIRQQCHYPRLIEQICKEEGYSMSRLERHMKEIVGMGPKKFQRIMRFNSAIGYIKKNNYKCHWARLAYQFGYYDQMHFIRECKTFFGKTPTALHKKDNWLMDIVHA